MRFLALLGYAIMGLVLVIAGNLIANVICFRIIQNKMTEFTETFGSMGV